jgi:hypothetical protein
MKQKNLDGEHNPIKSSHLGKRANHDEAVCPDVAG